MKKSPNFILIELVQRLRELCLHEVSEPLTEPEVLREVGNQIEALYPLICQEMLDMLNLRNKVDQLREHICRLESGKAFPASTLRQQLLDYAFSNTN